MRGVDMMVLVDVSNSMLAQDVSPSRMERAKRKFRDLIDLLAGDRVGLVAAMTHEGCWRTEPGYRAEHYKQAWHGLEQAYAGAHRPVERAAVRGRMEAFVEGLERDPEGERQLLAREAGRVRVRGDEQAPPLRELVAERERARAWEEERARVLIRKRSRGLSL